MKVTALIMAGGRGERFTGNRQRDGDCTGGSAGWNGDIRAKRNAEARAALAVRKPAQGNDAGAFAMDDTARGADGSFRKDYVLPVCNGLQGSVRVLGHGYTSFTGAGCDTVPIP